MQPRYFDKTGPLGDDEDWVGNNVAVRCPCCGKVFIVSAFPPQHGGTRNCPKCGKSTGRLDEQKQRFTLKWDCDALTAPS